MKKLRIIAAVLLALTGEAFSGCRGTNDRLAGPPPSEVKQALSTLHRGVLNYVLEEGDRLEYAKVTHDIENRRLVVESPQGTYSFVLARNTGEAHEVPPRIRKIKGRFTATLVIDPQAFSEERISEVRGLVRSTLLCDPWLHPLGTLPDSDPNSARIPTYIQREGLSSLLSMVKGIRDKFLKIGLFMPGGNGKTITAAKFARMVQRLRTQERAPGWEKKLKVFYVVNNIRILDQTEQVFRRELGFTKISKIYDEHAEKTVPDTEAELILITRESLYRRLGRITQLLTSGSNQPWLIILDEAHHTEGNEGEFRDIRNKWDRILDHRHILLGMSQLFGGRDSELFTQWFEKRVWGPYLSDAELTQLRSATNLPRLARDQSLRSQLKGYSPTLEKLTIKTEANGRNFGEIMGSSHVEGNRRYVQTYTAFLEDLAETLRENRQPNVIHRGIIRVRLTSRADAIARELATKLGRHAEIRAYHSNGASDPETLEWFADKGTFSSTENRRIHKYLVVVDALTEGYDVPAINIVVLAYPFSSSFEGFNSLRQTVARASRVFATQDDFKPGIRIIAYTESADWLYGELSGLFPPRQRGQNLGRKTPLVQIDTLSMDPVELQARYFEFFPELKDFATHFSAFEFDTFVSEALPIIRDQARCLGITNWTKRAKITPPKDLALLLAQRLPSGLPGRDKLIGRLSNDAYWGWAVFDGSDATRTIKSAQRIYRALYEIAAFFRLLPEGRDIDLSVLHTEKGMRVFFDRFIPEHKSFAQEVTPPIPAERLEMGLTYLHEQAGNFGIRNFTNGFGARDLMIEIAILLPPSTVRDRLIEELRDDANWGWTEADGMQARHSRRDNEPAVQRLFRALYRIAAVYNRSSESPVDLNRIHLPPEISLLLDRLDPDRAHSLSSGEKRRTFLDPERGAWAVLAHESLERNLGAISDPNGAARLLESLVGNFSTIIERQNLMKRLENELRLEKTDGARLNSTHYRQEQESLDESRVRGNGSLQRIFRAFYAVAKALKNTPEGAGIDLSRLHTAEEAEKVLSVLNPGRVRSYLDEEKMSIFLHPENGSLSVLAGRSSQLGVNLFVRDYGALRLLEKLLDLLPQTAETEELRKDFNNKEVWGWSAKDGTTMLSDGYPTPTRRFYRALARLSDLANRLRPELNINLNRLHEREEIERFLDSLQFGFEIHIQAPTTRYRSNIIATLGVLEERAEEFGVSAYVTRFGPKRMAIELASLLQQSHPDSPLPKLVLKTLSDDESWGWSKGDGDMIKNGTSEKALRSCWRAVYAIAATVNKIEGREVFDLKTIYSQKGLHALLDYLQE